MSILFIFGTDKSESYNTGPGKYESSNEKMDIGIYCDCGEQLVKVDNVKIEIDGEPCIVHQWCPRFSDKDPNHAISFTPVDESLICNRIGV